jgi:putative ABC transport system permease protein
MISGILESACQQGFLYALAAYGIVIAFRVLNFPDLTVDGSFTLGAAVFASMLIAGQPAWLCMGAAAIAGFAAGSATVALNRRLGISKILSGILIMLILYSINLRIMGRANISLLHVDTIFGGTGGDSHGRWDLILQYCLIAVGVLLLLGVLFCTRPGLFIRATGDNEFMVRGLGVNTNWTILLGIGLANMLVATSGALVAQSQGFADISMGVGLIITGLAAVIIGESLMNVLSPLWRLLVLGNRSEIIRGSWMVPWRTFAAIGAALVGSIVYFVIIAVCLRLGLAPTDLRLATGILVILGVSIRFGKPVVETYQRGKW